VSKQEAISDDATTRSAIRPGAPRGSPQGRLRARARKRKRNRGESTTGSCAAVTRLTDRAGNGTPEIDVPQADALRS
jgi:hypothetical protein